VIEFWFGQTSDARVVRQRVVHGARILLVAPLDAHPLEPGRKSLRDILVDEALLADAGGKRSIVTGRPVTCGSISGAIDS
jgi:hypothetical protein